MDFVSDLVEWRAYADCQRRAGRRVGLVPTMGALHEGHASLIRRAKQNGDVVLVSVFINPRQFNDAHDLLAYPRTPERDQELALEYGVDCLIEPPLDQMWPYYPGSTPTTVSVRGVSDTLEGAERPGHFDGVASVVAKLFTITGPCRAYFGEKDFQQLAVIRQLVRDLAFDVEVVGCATVRDETGLAISSRNVALSDAARARATAFSRALARVGAHPAVASELRTILTAVLEEARVEVAYVEIVDPVGFEPASDRSSGEYRAMLAGVVDGVRLIDNGPVTLVAREDPCC